LGLNLKGVDSLVVNDSLAVDSIGLAKIDTSSSVVDSITIDSSIDSIPLVDSLVNTSIEIDTSSSIIDSLDKISDPLLDSLMNASLDMIEFYDFDYIINDRELMISKPWKEGHEYQLIILPGGIKDIYGRGCDTITFDFKTASKDEYGNITLTVADLDSLQQYIVILRDGETRIKHTIIKDVKKEEVSFKRLAASTYNIQLIKDENRDGKWTTGDYWKHRQPELLKKFELEKLRENWDLQATISWDGTTVDTLGSGIDSTFMQLDSLNQQQPSAKDSKSKEPKRKNTEKTTDKKRGIREQRG